MNPHPFGESLNAALLGAQRLAVRRGQDQCEPVHLLWELLSNDTASAAGELRRQGYDVARIRQRVEAELPSPLRAFGDTRTRRVREGVLRVSPALKTVLDAASARATESSAPEVNEQHVLYAFTRLDDVDVRDLISRVGLGPSPAERIASRDVNDGTSLLGMISQYGRDLTAEARAGELDPVVGRREELRRVMHILGRRRKNNPVLIGEPGVGKTAIVEGLASAIAADTVPDALRGKHIFALDIGSVVAGTKYRGEFEERIQLLLDAIARSRGTIILFIDELHLIARAGGAEGAIDAASFFKPLLARGDLHAIGATTVAEYREHIARDGALERRFQPVYVREPTAAETVAMLRGLRPKYESYHRVTISDEAISAAVDLGIARLRDRRLPDKAIDLVDEAASELRAEQSLARTASATAASASAGERTAVVGPDDVRRVVDEWVGSDGHDRWTSRVYGRQGVVRRILRR